jgi:hypothetical protein
LLLRAKIDNKSNVGLAGKDFEIGTGIYKPILATHALSPNLKLTVSTLFGLSAANKSNTLGVGFEFSA